MVTSLTRLVIDDISQQIDNGVLKPGGRLPSAAQLRQRYGVSITVVRGAVQWLKAIGLVEGVPGVGVFVVVPHGETTKGNWRLRHGPAGQLRQGAPRH
jgi:DNA-binding FadR family transcriptional regulator